MKYVLRAGLVMFAMILVWSVVGIIDSLDSPMPTEPPVITPAPHGVELIPPAKITDGTIHLDYPPEYFIVEA